MDRADIASQIEIETKKRLFSENAAAFTIFKSCIKFNDKVLSVELVPDIDLYSADAIESFNSQLQYIHCAVKKFVEEKYQ